jgi:hypothetical protein
MRDKMRDKVRFLSPLFESEVVDDEDDEDGKERDAANEGQMLVLKNN